jgi:branched-chain amino acid aminotransferase
LGFFASVNGQIAPAEEARVSVLDNGFTFGDGVYETLRTYGGTPFRLDRHLRRLRASAVRLGIEVPLGDTLLRRWLTDLLARAANPESYVRLVVTRGQGDISYNFDRVIGPTVVMVVKPFHPYPDHHYREGVDVILSRVRRNHPLSLDPAIKSCNLLNNILAVREAQARGATEALLLNHAGEVAEGASTNVFVVSAGTVVTPPLDAGILAGITREAVLELGRGLGLAMREQPLPVADLWGADEAFLTSSTRELAPVRALEGRAIGGGKPGPITLRLLATFREEAARPTA